MELTKGLVEDVRAGRVVLLLGAGASAGAQDEKGQGPPLGNALRDRIVDKFLADNFKERNLAVVSDLAINEQDLFRVQDFVADQFRRLQPADFHKELASFRWRAIATTNYDQIIEMAYRQNENRIQELVPILSDEYRVDEKLRSQDQLALLKLHGCITITHRKDLPLILTIDQYSTHRENRTQVFNRFEGLASEYPVIFVGHRLEDTDVREMLRRLTSSIATRPRYYLIDPNCEDIETRFWESKKVTVLKGTLQDFLNILKSEIPAEVRPLLKLVNAGHPIRQHFKADDELPSRIERMLEEEVEYIHSGMNYEKGTPSAFYRGFDLKWYPVREDLDVRRRLVDTLLTDVIIRSEDDRPFIAELYGIRSEAGSGKTVLLRRLAWESATEADVLVLYVRKYGSPNPDDLSELVRLTSKRLFLLWDNAADHVAEIGKLMTYARQKNLPITVITAERANEWNMSCDRLDQFLADSFELRYLNEDEVKTLAQLLEVHNCLGPNLRDKTLEQRVSELKARAGRQLLVALHEATMGAPFEDILQNEYENLRPLKAQQLYLTVCVLNRLRTPVRAGFISRVHDIPLEEFNVQLFKPLAQVVEVNSRNATGDYYYLARHPEIAQIVFTRMLSDQTDRFNEYIRIIDNLNLSYNTDLESFRGLLKAKSLHDSFPAYQDVKAIFDKAMLIGAKEAYLYQQRANYERIRPDGNLRLAEDYLHHARELDPRDPSITHTLAEIYRSHAEKAKTKLKRQRFREEARSLIRPLIGNHKQDQYAQVTMVKLGIDEVRDLLEQGDAADREIDAAIREVDRLLEKGLQSHPGDQYLHTAEADFSALVSDNERSFAALQNAFIANPRDPYIANRLARLHQGKGDSQSAKDTLAKALEANRGDLRLNFQFAEILRATGELDTDVLTYYYERSFTPGDRNYEAQFWFARFSFESTDEKRVIKSKETFRLLRTVTMPHAKRILIKDLSHDNNGTRIFHGTVERIDSTFGRIRRDGTGDLIFAHANGVEEQCWKSLRQGGRVTFSIGYNFGGPNAVEVDLSSKY